MNVRNEEARDGSGIQKVVGKVRSCDGIKSIRSRRKVCMPED